LGTARGERSRKAILKAVVPLVAEHGYRGVSLACRADPARATALLPLQAELLLALLAERDQEDAARVQASGREGLDLLPALEGLVAHNQTARQLIQLFTVLVGEGVSSSHPAHDYFVDR
jgi:hypothetical protein